MADKQKFEKMLELLVNEDREGAEELFHEIVVEQSRSIYETILESDLSDEEVDESDDEDDDEVDESSDEEVDESDDEVDESDDELEEDFDLDEFEVEADPADDMMGDVQFGGDDEEGDDDEMGMDSEEEPEGDIEDRVVDVEDAIDELKAEFDKMMASNDMGDMDDEEGDEEGDDEMPMGMDDDEGEEDDDETEEYGYEDFAFEDEEEDTNESKKSESEVMREYVDKIAGKGGLDVSNSNKSEASGTNTQSTVASKNDMGGTASNILRTDTENSGEAGAGSKIKGSALNDQSTKEDNAGNVNVPGGKAAKSNSAMTKGHGTEKKGSADTASNKRSLIGSKK